MTPDHRPWLTGLPPNPGARLRLFCFPSAGGGASAYIPWGELLPAGVELCRVQLPGRESRFVEPAFESLDDLLPAVHQALRPFLDVPFAFFGHSMGALISFELTRRLRNAGDPGPVALFPSGHRGPHLPLRRRMWAELPGDELMRELSDLNGIPQELLGNKEVLDLVLPTLRADLRLYEAYAHEPDEPLPCPIAAFGGDGDLLVNKGELEGWRQHTSANSDVHVYRGNHFFLQTQRDPVLRDLSRHLAGLLESRL